MSKKETKEIALIDSYSIMAPGVDIKDVIEANLGDDGLTAADLDRIKVPSGGGKVWTIPTINGEQDLKELDAIIIHTEMTRAYWEDEYDGSGTPPDCESKDCITGVGNPGGSCELCPFSKYDSGKGKAQACTQKKPMFLVREDSMFPIILNAPPTSLRNIRKYLVRLTGANQAIHSKLTRLTLEKVTPADKPEYSRIIFTPLENITGDALAKVNAYVAEIKPYLQRAAMEDARAPERPAGEQQPGAQSMDAAQ